jgi:hypothetical protein
MDASSKSTNLVGIEGILDKVQVTRGHDIIHTEGLHVIFLQVCTGISGSLNADHVGFHETATAAANVSMAGRGGTETVGDQKIVFAWFIRGSNIVDYYDNIRFQVEGEDFARLYDM